ncbi:MAG: hypothetical protein HGB10_06690 [Coriobacteriia bacterium]|nr:hypothetical protein [Coriobacteriia bacterium]
MSMPRRSRITVIAVVVVLVAAMGLGWYAERSVTSPNAPQGAYRVRVTRDGDEIASFDLAGLAAVGERTVTTQGGVERGAPVVDVLAAAGVSGCSTVTVLGMGTRDSGRLEIAYADLGPDTVLDVAKRGTVKVAGPLIPRDMRVRDVTEIQVR